VIRFGICGPRAQLPRSLLLERQVRLDLRRILVLDDDPRVSKALRLVLEHEGFEVTTAADGRTGLGLLEKSEFDLAIIDIFMPGADGLETIRTLRQRLPSLPIIVMSGLQYGGSLLNHNLTVPDFLKVALQFGASFALHKPFQPDELLRAISACAGLVEHDASERRDRQAS
jgi:two-component system response regulator (stage 0 sporulation protein F)